MYYQQLSDSEIIRGFRLGDAEIIRDYFYGYCRAGYLIFDQRYQLSEKENLDCMSLTHQYALYLLEHDWRPLEDHSPEVSLKTWLINGFRYVVLDALKWYRREYGSITFEDYMCSFDIQGGELRLQFNRMVEDVCEHAPLSHEDRLIIDLLLRQGFKGKEIAAQLRLTPSAISQRFKRLKQEVIRPYFLKYFDLDMDMAEVIAMPEVVYHELAMGDEMACNDGSFSYGDVYGFGIRRSLEQDSQKRSTPEHISALRPNEIYVFGSNLKGMHLVGEAYNAYRRFGAVMGQAAGLQGQSYGIPSMQGGVETIRPYVDEFIRFAKEHTALTFLVTRIGCGVAGFTDEKISPLFQRARNVENIVLPKGW